jgi:aryl-alcohol dehydrogenase-like predicted oxidoreductase
MERVRLGKSELQVSPIAFGTWSFGGDWGRFDTDEARATVGHALELGITPVRHRTGLRLRCGGTPPR